MKTPAGKLIEDINTYLNNPSLLQQRILDFTRQATDGEYDFVDPTNPVVNVIESAVLIGSSTIDSFNSVLRKQYPSLAQSYEDLFRHMSDEDYINRFAVPSSATISVMFRKDELFNKMVDVPNTSYKKIVIPRDTVFNVSGTEFMPLYPIDIRRLSHGGLQIVFNNDKPNPFYTLETNYLNWSERTDRNNNRYIYIEIPVKQLSISSKLVDVSSSVSFRTTLKLTDEFYHARVFLKDSRGNWNEVRTTHSDSVYDKNYFTAVLRVFDDTLEVTVPDIYTLEFELNRALRIDLYETKGPVNMMLDKYNHDNFEVKWQAQDDKEFDEFVAPLQTIESLLIFSNSVVSGGRRGLTFNELRERLITNAVGNPSIPVSNVQIQTALEDQNYEIVKNIDNITNRVYLATRSLPAPTHEKLITPANASIQSGIFSLTELSEVSSVKNNGLSVTITPNTIFESINGRLTILSDAEKLDILAQTPDRRAGIVNSRELFFSPFYYVLDSTEDIFDFRAYHLDDPSVDNKTFIAENDSNGYQANIGNTYIRKVEDGYILDVELRTSSEFKELEDSTIYTQLAFRAKDESGYCYLNGELIGLSDNNERVYRFYIESNFEISRDNAIVFKNFKMYDESTKNFSSYLTDDFDFLIAHTNPVDSFFNRNEVDDSLGREYLPSTIYGVIKERLTIRFGDSLSNLWTRARSIVTPSSYKTHTTSKLKRYSENVYKINPETGTPVFINEQNEPEVYILHHKGDIVEIDGEEQYEYVKGDIVLDDEGNPVIDKPREVKRDCDYLFVEATYWFATDTIASSYISEFTRIFAEWIMTGLEEINKRLIEQTSIFFYPKTSTGFLEVMVGEGELTTIKANQEFSFILHVSGQVYRNNELKNKLREVTVSVLNEALKRPVVSHSYIVKELREIYGEDVIDVEMLGFGGENKYSTVTLIHETDRLSIKKVLRNLPDNTLIVEEAVDLIFIKHEIE